MAQGDDQKLGWSGNVVTVDLVGDGSSDEDNDEAEFQAWAVRRQEKKNRARQGSLDSDLAHYGVARMPAAPLQDEQLSLDEVVAITNQERPPSVAQRSSRKKSRRRSFHAALQSTPSTSSAHLPSWQHDDSSGVVVTLSDSDDCTPAAMPPPTRARTKTTTRSSEKATTATPMMRVWEVFPDADAEEVISLLCMNGMDEQDLVEPLKSPQQDGIIQKVLEKLGLRVFEDDDVQVLSPPRNSQPDINDDSAKEAITDSSRPPKTPQTNTTTGTPQEEPAKTPKKRVLEVFPDVDAEQVVDLLCIHGMDAKDVDEPIASPTHDGVVLSALADLGKRVFDDGDVQVLSPPRTKIRKRKRSHVSSRADDDSVEVVIVTKTPSDNTITNSSAVEVVAVLPNRTTPIQHVLDVFPEVDVPHLESLLTELGIPKDGLRQPSVADHELKLQAAISRLAESSYPKSKAAMRNRNTLVQRSGVLKSYKHDYMSTSSFTPSPQYIDQAVQLLMTDFPFMSKSSIKKHLASCQNHYAVFYDNVCNAITGKTKDPSTPSGQKTTEGDETKHYYALTCALAGTLIPIKQEQRLKKLQGISSILKRPRRNTKIVPCIVTEPILKDEIDYVQNKQRTWMSEMESVILRAKARKESERIGSTMECQCCFADVAMEEMISCKEEGHLFCVDCLRRFAEEQVFGQGNLGVDKSTNTPALELKCMFGEGCSSGFEPDHLRKALPEKVLAKYDELQFRATVERAGIQDMCTCPKCGFQAVLPPTEMIFRCPVEDCLRESCRKCGEDSHIPLRCEEVEKKNETHGRLKVEEAISAAKIRTCPKPACRKKFVKSDGCNKMTCSCGTWVCYICRSEIPKSVGYKHFCQKFGCKHKTCGVCPLYSEADEDDARAMREAGIRAAEEVREESLLEQQQGTGTTTAATGVSAQSSSNANEVRINVESLLEPSLPGRTHQPRVLRVPQIAVPPPGQFHRPGPMYRAM